MEIKCIMIFVFFACLFFGYMVYLFIKNIAEFTDDYEEEDDDNW